MQEEMNNHSEKTIQAVENTNDECFFESVSNENRRFFKKALSEVITAKINEIDEKTENKESPSSSKRHKIRMNRIFRERIGGSFLPFPEEDNLYEKLRSNLVIKLKINEFLDRRKERKRER